MIKNIIFDFGDIFINLDKEIVLREIQRQGVTTLAPEALALSSALEIGAITPDAFVKGLNAIFPMASSQEIIAIWNGMILDMPDYRLEFIERLAKEQTHRLFLLSNTNVLHIEEVVKIMGEPNYNRFKNCFEQFYLSHEIQLRKPNADIYEFVLRENQLKPAETLFIDDTIENTDAASRLGIQTWHLKVGEEDIIALKSRL